MGGMGIILYRSESCLPRLINCSLGQRHDTVDSGKYQLIGEIWYAYQYRTHGWKITTYLFTIRSSLQQSILLKIILHETIQRQPKCLPGYGKLYWFTLNIAFAEFSQEVSINRTSFVGPKSNMIAATPHGNLAPVTSRFLRQIVIPNKFGVIDMMQRISFLKACFEDIGSYWVSTPISEPKLFNHVVWDAINNNLYGVFTLSTVRIYESGMFDR